MPVTLLSTFGKLHHLNNNILRFILLISTFYNHGNEDCRGHTHITYKWRNISYVSLLFFPFMLSVHSVVSNSKQPHGLQHARLLCLSPTLRAYSNSYQVSDDIQPSHLLSFPSPHAFNLSQHQGLFQRVNSLHQVTIPLFLWLHLQYRF